MCCLSALLFLPTSCSSAATPDARPTSDCSGSNRGGYAIPDLPADVTTRGQIINLAAGSDQKQFPVTLLVTGELTTETFSPEAFSLEGLGRLETGLQGADWPQSFTWPRQHDRN
jgi:hypothetical protein